MFSPPCTTAKGAVLCFLLAESGGCKSGLGISAVMPRVSSAGKVLTGLCFCLWQWKTLNTRDFGE